MRPAPTALSVTRSQCLVVISRKVNPRIATARACAPVLPDWPAAMGSKIAKAVNLAMVASNAPTTAAARKAVKLGRSLHHPTDSMFETF